LKEVIYGEGKSFGFFRNNREEDEKKAFDKEDSETDGKIVKSPRFSGGFSEC
jgi:hypothetical protein